MLRIAIAEDDPESAEKLQEFVRRYCAENQVEQETTYFRDGLALVNDYRPVWDLIFWILKCPIWMG